MRTDWNFTTSAFFTRSSLKGSIGALDQYVVGFVTATTKNVGIETRTTNIFVGVDSSGLSTSQDVYYIPGTIYPNTKILSITEGITIVSQQLLTVGLTTSIIYGVNTSGITTDTKILPRTNVIAQNTSIVSIGSTSIEISPPSLNTQQIVGIATTTLSFYNRSGQYSIELTARTTNSFFQTVNLGFGTGTVVGVGSTFLDNTTLFYPSGAPIVYVDDLILPVTGIITQGYKVVGLGTTGTNKVYFNYAGINTVSISTVGLIFGYYGDATRVTTGRDYGDLLDVKFSDEKVISINSNTISLDTSQLSTNQYLDPVTGVFDNEQGTYITQVNGGSININVSSSNTEAKKVQLKIGNLIVKETKRYAYNPFSSFTFEFLTKPPKIGALPNGTAYPAYGNPPGSSNGDPSLRYKYGFPPTSFDVNHTLGAKDFPMNLNSREFAHQKGKRNYSGPLYPRHVFGR